MTTETANCVPTEFDRLGALEAAVAELECRANSQFRTVREPATRIRREAEELGAEELYQRAELLIASVDLREGRVGEGGQSAHRVQAWAERHDSSYLLARAHRQLSVFYRYVGDAADGLKHAVQGVALLTDDWPVSIRAQQLMALSVALEETGSPVDGERRAREALALAMAAGDHETTLLALNNMVYSAYENNDEPAARAMVAEMHEIQARTGHRFGANELDTMARVELMGAHYDAVEDLLTPVMADLVVANEGDAVAECLLTLALARRLAGRYPAAQAALDANLRICGQRGLAAIRARIREEQAALYAATGRYAEAYEEHRAFHADSAALLSVQRDARARALQAVFDANEARRASEHFREMAHRDALTGLHNRRYVNERLPALLLEAAAEHRPISIAIVDLDHFKRVNDTLSHATGDTVLQHVAEMLADAVPGPALAARMGGEEFMLVYPGIGPEEAAVRCERLRLRIRAHAWGPITGALPVTTSIGITTSMDGHGTLSSLLAQADRNLYTAKRAGRDRVVGDIAA
ncbi:GGDEF domain-containing protein [Actinoplanes awajinensis]|uniref:Diguanylate cyclase n=1 Tax=Actinoplanes awajinensis subsp. mycoplanecinus TaxID=135947 RepID=A0A101JUC3_9ACTN|nr:GGDEF domain-containing protein [Actinoplanes awajinensis]KUL32586.1 diguanylate cyclase [Actinoplanes awajinensis subsp. mycoplanecinus]